MIITPRTKEDLEKLIGNKIEENLHLEYKAADALHSSDSKKKEIVKDVSAFANSAGGIIIYGIKEFDESVRKHLPEKITPVDRNEFSKERLEQIINGNISPRIEGLIIHPVVLDNLANVVYVVEIPQSNTAHQSTLEGRYYRRYNFQSVWMVDHEVRDVMNRSKHPVIKIGFEIERYSCKEMNSPLFRTSASSVLATSKDPREQHKSKTIFTLKMHPVNIGKVVAQYINYFVLLPEDVVDIGDGKYLKRPLPGLIEYYGENTHRDLLDVQYTSFSTKTKYGPSRFDPVLPGLRGRSEQLSLAKDTSLDNREITWTVYADNASPKAGSIKLSEIVITEKQEIGDD